MRVLRLLGVVIVSIFALSLFLQPADSQDNYDQRIGDLETRVASLEATVASLPADATTGTTESEETYLITGTFSLRGDRDDFSVSSRTGECFGKGGYDDLYVGAQVRVTDATGALLGLGELEDDATSKRCDFVFTVEVPYSNFYQVAAGHAGRQGPSYSFDEMVDNDWEVALSMG